MQIQAGYELVFRCRQPTPMVVTLSIHYSRVSDLIKADHLVLTPSIPVTAYRDSFGNWCSRIVAPPGQLRLSSDAVVSDTGNPDLVAPWLEQRPVEALPEETLLFLLGSRYCETDLLSETAWRLFNAAPTGWKRVQAICDFVHQHIQFGYGLCGLVRGLSRRRLVHLRCSQQYAPHRAHPDRPRQRRGGCRAHNQLRAVDAGKPQGVDG